MRQNEEARVSEVITPCRMVTHIAPPMTHLHASFSSPSSSSLLLAAQASSFNGKISSF